MRDYGKVHTSFWSSASIRSLSEDARTLAFYLLTNPHGTIAGVFRLPDGYVMEDLQWGLERVNKGFNELVAEGFVNRCGTTKWVQIINHFTWNPLENPNQRKAAAKVAHQIPESCAWKPDFMRVCADILGIESTTKNNHSETLSEPFLNQDQEQEQYLKPPNPLAEAKVEPPREIAALENQAVAKLPTATPCDHDGVISAYHEILPELPRVAVWGKERERKLKARWNGDKRHQTLDFWRWFFESVRSNPHWLGDNGKGWRADLEWFLSPSNFARVIERGIAAQQSRAA